MGIEPLFLEFTDAGLTNIAAAVSIAIGAMAPAIAIGWLVGRAMDALGRNPEARGAIQTNMILGVAFAEAIAIYGLLVAIIIKFV